MVNILLTARGIEAILNRALADYEASNAEFSLLKVQLLIFYYDGVYFIPVSLKFKYSDNLVSVGPT